MSHFGECHFARGLVSSDTMARYLLRLLLFVLLLPALPAAAQDPLTDGQRLVAAGRYQQALDVLLPAYMDRPSALTAQTIARAYDGLQDDPRAMSFYRSALSQRGLSRRARKHAKSRLRIIKARLRSAPRKATLSLRATAQGALVQVDGVSVGRTPLSGVLISPGRHRIKVSDPKRHYDDWTRAIQAAPFEQIHLEAQMVDRPTTVFVNTQPAGATAVLENGQRCATPCLFELRAGRYRINLSRDGYQPLTHTFDKPPGQMIELRLTLQPGNGGAAPVVTGQGYLTVSVDRGGAQIQVDGRPLGRSPASGPFALSAGIHRVTVTFPGFQPFGRDVGIAAGQTQTVTVQLVPLQGMAPPTPVTPTPVVTPNPIQPTPVVKATPKTRSPRVIPEPIVAEDHGGHAVAWALVGTGAALMAGGGAFLTVGLLNQRKFNTAVRFKIEEQLYVSGLTRQDVLDLEATNTWMMPTSYALLGVGTGLLVTGIVLLTTEPDSKDPFLAPSLSIAPVLGPGFVGATSEWRF